MTPFGGGGLLSAKFRLGNTIGWFLQQVNYKMGWGVVGAWGVARSQEKLREPISYKRLKKHQPMSVYGSYLDSDSTNKIF